MSLYVSPKQETINFFHNVLKETSTIKGEIKNYRQGEQTDRNFYAQERKGYGDYGKENRNKGANSATTNFPSIYFWILNMFGVKHISSHPV